MRLPFRHNDKSKQPIERLVSDVGLILIRVYAEDSHMTMWDIDLHRVPGVLRSLADSYEAEHCPDGTMNDHKHQEEEKAWRN